jgi:two-component system chemotaxis response regulator CheY
MARILFIDDDPITLEMLAKAVGLHGHAALSCTIAADALAVAAQEQPDLIFLDMNMPNTDGVALIRALRAEPETAEIPAVMLSASPELDIVSHVRAAGGQGYLLKPVKIKDLIEVISEHTRQ